MVSTAPARATAVLRARGLSAGYSGSTVIRDVDLYVDPGEVVALMGPNGAGKTTTLRALAGWIPPQGGSVELGGQPTRQPLHRRARSGLSWVSEDRSVFMGLTAWENLRLGRGEPEKALALFPELKPLLGRRCGLLSGGEQQILSVARALSSDPKILIIDELSMGLAPKVVTRLLDAVRAAREAGTSVLLVEQFARQALAVADRAYVMARGRITMSGTAEDMSQRLLDIEDAYLSADE